MLASLRWQGRRTCAALQLRKDGGGGKRWGSVKRRTSGTEEKIGGGGGRRGRADVSTVGGCVVGCSLGYDNDLQSNGMSALIVH